MARLCSLLNCRAVEEERQDRFMEEGRLENVPGKGAACLLLEIAGKGALIK